VNSGPVDDRCRGKTTRGHLILDLLDKNILLQQPPEFRLRLRKGHIMLIAGGAIAAISLSVLGYYGLRLITNLEEQPKYSIPPSGSQQVQQNIANVSQGAYVVSFPNYDGGKPMVTLADPTGRTIVQKEVNPPILIESFPINVPGNYTLELSNPSPVQTLEASIILGSQESVLSTADISSAVMTLIFGFMLVAGIATAIAGAVITVMDKRRIARMKQFGDTTDLV
jgi:hypothetical protein